MDRRKAIIPTKDYIEQNCCIVCRPCPTTPKYILCRSKNGKKHCVRLLPKGCMSESVVNEEIYEETDEEKLDKLSKELNDRKKLIEKARAQYKSRYDNFYNNYNIEYRNNKCTMVDTDD